MAKRRGGFGIGEDDDPKNKVKVSKEGIKKTLRLFRFVLPYKVPFGIGMVFLVFSSATTLSFPMLIGEMTRVMEGNSSYSLNQVTLFFGGILLAQGIFSFFRVYFFAQVSERTSADIRREVYQQFVSLPISFFEKRRVGELTSRITSDVSSLQDVLSITLAEFFRQIATLIVGIGVILFLSWKLTLFMLATFPILVGSALIFGKYIRKFAKKAQDKLAEANVVVEETLQSIQVVKAFTNESLEVKRYSGALAEVVEIALKAAGLRGAFISFFIVGMFGGIVAVVWYGGGLVTAGEMQLADLLTFLFYTTFIGGSMGGLGDLYAQLQRSIGASERLVEILDEKPEVDLFADVSISRLQGEIRYEEVAFSYPARPDVEVLKPLSFTIQPGEKIALVGQSGAGKSTIVQLLMQMYPLEKGVIRVDGKAASTYNISELRANMAIVPQEVMLFGGSIYENILYGKPNSTREEVEAAAQKANAWEFIEGFPEKMDTLVGERGVKLSGGQRQRIAIARAILRDPAILILDEATSALDAASERLVQDALDKLMKNRTTIIIAHRLATIRNVDRIFVLKGGQIVESGKHDELLAKPDGMYANLVKLQLEKSPAEIE
ncbi:MAG: ABC transporter ATP-binding protein [Spirosomataceae bacterium]